VQLHACYKVFAVSGSRLHFRQTPPPAPSARSETDVGRFRQHDHKFFTRWQHGPLSSS